MSEDKKISWKWGAVKRPFGSVWCVTLVVEGREPETMCECYAPDDAKLICDALAFFEKAYSEKARKSLGEE